MPPKGSKNKPREIYEIDGIFYNGEGGGKRRPYGTVAGSVRYDGYCTICINGRSTYRHILVWEKYNGPVPEGYEVDHINGIPGDDRIENLQILTHYENITLASNRLAKTNKSGYSNVSFSKRRNKYYACIKHRQKTIAIGFYDCPKEAHDAVIKYRIDNGIPLSRRHMS